jgi:hypothetical protein
MTLIRQHGVAGGNAVAEKRIDFSYDGLGQYATVTTYANLAGTQLVSTATYTFDNAYQLVGLTYAKGTTRETKGTLYFCGVVRGQPRPGGRHRTTPEK